MIREALHLSKAKDKGENLMPGIRRYLRSQTALMQLFYGPDSTRKPATVAAEIDVSYKTFMKYVQGLTPCPAEILAQLYTLTHFDPIRQVLTPEGYQIVPLKPASPDKESLEGEIMDDICQATRLCEAYRENIADGHLAPHEYTRLVGIMNDLRNEVEQTLQKLMELKPMSVKLVQRQAR
jgi:hypothetical protein